MNPPGGGNNPITAQPGQVQLGVDPMLLLPSRAELLQVRLAFQRGLIQTGRPRATPIQVTREGVIWDGHHAVRAAAELGVLVDVRVIAQTVPPSGPTILQLPVR
jgi:hypothetical protein